MGSRSAGSPTPRRLHRSCRLRAAARTLTRTQPAGGSAAGASATSSADSGSSGLARTARAASTARRYRPPPGPARYRARVTDSPLLQVLDVRPAGDALDVFTGPNLRHWRTRLFGGQVLGQVAVAAGRTVTGDRDLHSLHAYFLRPGQPDVPVAFSVERLRDGRSFSARRVQATQNGVPILSAIASFQTRSEGLDHAEPAPDVPDPEDLPSDQDLLAALDHPVARQLGEGRHVDVRHVEPALYLAPDPAPRRGSRCGCAWTPPCPGRTCCTGRRWPTPATCPCWNRSCAATGWRGPRRG